MEKIKIFFVTIFLTLINVSIASAAPATPPPAPMAAAAPPPPPPGGAIDQNLILLLICALLFGMYTIYKYNLKRKASM
ncbi:hypothetical protein [Flavobacterium chilense]|uniref:Signal peptidase n=1 Tax=Flavobacterium chilense TaxID=946677 RepID=A0A1M7DQW1_9FLAO|nr:hypothetical protein [Flavobacterium chilense]SHL81880.1 hypothetical protein SAMN05444484_102684 [Flavobacterium chilense]